MRAVHIERFGGPEVLVPATRARPEPGPRDVRVAVEVCGVCRHDALTRAGAFPGIALPVVPGHQIAGWVDAVGSEVHRVRAGDAVMSMVHQTCGWCEECRRGRQAHCHERPRFLGEDLDGGYAELVVADEDVWLPRSDGLSAEQGAVLTCSLGTAFHAVVGRGRAEAGETALVTGATGGVGLATVRLLRALGLRVIALTRSAGKADDLHAAGADEVVVAAGSYRQAVKDRTGRGADLAIEIVGGAGLVETIHSVRPGGRIVVLGNIDGGTVELRPAHLILKEISLIGTKSVTRDELARVAGMVARGVLAVEVAARWPLDRAADAHRALEAGEIVGRAVLDVGGSP